MTDWPLLLAANAGAQIFFAVLLGWAMLLPTRPGSSGQTIDHRQLWAAHLDWIMLGLSQTAAALIITEANLTHSALAAVLLIAGGWLNPLPYLFRAFGIDAFRYAGSMVQRASAALGGVSSVALTIGWLLLLVEAAPRISKAVAG